MTRLTVELVTPTRSLLKEEVDVVSAPTVLGEISVLPHHTPFVTAVAAGELRLRRGAETQSFAIAGGVLAVREGSVVVILTDLAERPEEISEAAVEGARRRAAELRLNVAADDAAFASASAALERELVRLRVVRKHRRHHGRHDISKGAAQS